MNHLPETEDTETEDTETEHAGPAIGFLEVVRARFFVLVLLVVLGIMAAFALEYLRPEKDNIPMAGVFVTLLLGAMAYLTSERTHLIVNKRMTQWMRAADKVSQASGHARAMEEMTSMRTKMIEEAMQAIAIVEEKASISAAKLLAVAEEKARDLILVAVQKANVERMAAQAELEKIQLEIAKSQSDLILS